MTFLKKIDGKYLTAKAKPKPAEPLDLKTKSKDFKIVAEELEVVARVNTADLVFRVAIDEEKLKVNAKKSFDSDLKDWERSGGESGDPKPVLDNYLQTEREHAAEELGRVKNSDVRARKDGTFAFSKYWYLKAELLFNGSPIQALYDAEFRYGGGEVHPVEDNEYKIKA